ncbi:MAG: anthranilate phosphoribosyltransferase [Euryarchaeota archaeon]|nr:anthranilate phosphoribosyltransferase [Euryarchaeota archaeon]MDE1837104.1 anthranilate phosphoribosyltransferase [Euryarchaeota archaeon]MDE1879684.1 anthranilate phosphoribosyltransferase [Euryarchaeota archaeon]MDE2045210.1 anthranilate phosphoribosyltransferase [Thermoplasmata archaeon]
MNVDPSTGPAALQHLVQGEDLGPEEAREVAEGLLTGAFPPEVVASLLTALAAKGESPEELYAFSSTLRARARPFPGPAEAGAVDLCGTGGAKTPTFNISTVSAFVLAGAGVPVAKHGNVSARRPCGSSDVLSALGLPVLRSVAFAEASWRKERLCFLHAPLFHAATRSVAPVRKALGLRTIFNQLGPLTNPAGVSTQLVGCFSREYARRVTPVLHRLGVHRSLAVHGKGGMDELSSKGTDWLLRSVEASGEGGGATEVSIDPSTLLSPEERRGDLRPRSPGEAAELTRAVLSGEGDGAVRGAVLLTAGAAIWLHGSAPELPSGVALARSALQDGRALDKLQKLQALARSQDWPEGSP